MKSRTIASLAATGIVLLTATGCGAMTVQATTFEYTASDGVNLPASDGPGLEVRNALVVADHDGADGNFIAVLINETDAEQTLALDWETGDATIAVPAGETLSLGAGAEPELLAGLDTIPGSTLSMYLQAGEAQGVEIEVPVLNNCLTEYAALAPNDSSADAEHCEHYEYSGGEDGESEGH
ncbi:DNA modification methylase [Microbacterium karelineae]|uniref:DNA modification methylase n=1 Tax=Microbacterium karelineae TaxID=2654283 RepID=UPI0018D2B6E5|nr:DNA modification methylase [Microbacterium karelineae]